MVSQDLPAVLIGRGNQSSISMERALHQIRDILSKHHALCCAEGDDREADATQASIDDVEMMILAIKR